MPTIIDVPKNINFNKSVVCCCNCYENYWRDMRKQSDNVNNTDFYFDESIERVQSFRKYFHKEKQLFHFCIDCFKKVVDQVPKSALNAYRYQYKGGCIQEHKESKQSIEELCDGCVYFAIDSFSADLFKKI